jgi:hypothetical protein
MSNRLIVAAISIGLLSLPLSNAIAATPSAEVIAAFQEVAMNDSHSDFTYLGKVSNHPVWLGRNMKWNSSPNLLIEGSPYPDDYNVVKNFLKQLSPICATTPTYVTPTISYITTVTTVHRRQVTTITQVIAPSTNVIMLNFLPVAAPPGLPSFPTSFRSDLYFTTISDDAYPQLHLNTTITNLYTKSMTSSDRARLIKHAILQSLGLFNATTNLSSKAFSQSAYWGTNWDGSFTDLDKAIIGLQCSASIASYSNIDSLLTNYK